MVGTTKTLGEKKDYARPKTARDKIGSAYPIQVVSSLSGSSSMMVSL